MATDGMSSAEQSLIYGFLLNALIRTESSNVLRAGRRASSMLRRVMAQDEVAIREVADLCNEADRWQGWQDSVNQVRDALRRHAARAQSAVKSKKLDPPPDPEMREAQEELRSAWWDAYERRFQESEAVAALEAAAAYGRLDDWFREASKPLEEFLELWEPAPDPEDAAD